MISAHIRLTRGTAFRLDLDLTLSSAVTALFGPSGAGKSTVLQVLAGLERGSRNDDITIRFDDEVWQGTGVFVPPHQRGVGYVFQQPQLFPHLSVAGNLRYAARRAKASRVGPA
ncbi:MAG: ATP-binding cassette domain-containing protein [Gammaproteobacteria bacterium]|nr:ATP-binding cassette domain-containing protein [Gammaproteobacteria bacterium]